MNSELATFASVKPQHKENLIFVDSTVENYQGLISATKPDSELVILDPSLDGIEQISAKLANYDNVAAVHIVSHGEPGSISLGNSELNLDTFKNYANELQGWSNSLSEEADILIYGCNVGADTDGATLVNKIKDATDADVAASTDATGSSALGGDWEWEINTGTIESGLAFTTEAIKAYNQVLASEGMTMEPGMMGGGMMMNHNNALMDLVPPSNTTHVAINNGGWSDPNTWENGQIPSDGANILIPNGIEVTYNQKSDARLDTLRVDGNLVFPSELDTKMLIDTFVVSSDGELDIGREDSPIQADKKAEIIFTSDTPLNTESDPQQLGRGLISHGKVEIHGADKLDYVGLSQDVFAGDNELILNLPNGETSPSGWQVGDQLVLGGTYHRFNGNNENNTRFHDEELTITAIEGNRIRFINNDITSEDNTVLRFDHQRPEGFTEELQLYVANTTRNVTFETENGENVPIDHRGHVMFMHNPNVRVENAGFYNLGRSDKSRLVDDSGQNVDGTPGTGTNPRGRYALHFHRTGAEDINSTPSLAKGNAIVGSPGWGIVQHDSHANIAENVVFDVAGAGIVAESGNEIGGWWNNLTMKITGDDENGFIPTKPEREKLFDFGFKGEGYWVQGAAQVEMTDNIAISTAGGAMSIFAAADSDINQYRDQPTFPVSNLPEELQAIASGGEESIDVTNLPLRRFSGFESYNSMAGIVFWTHMANTDGQLQFNGPGLEDPAHNFRSVVDDFQLWNIVSNGVQFQYTTQVDLVDGLIVGNVNQPSAIGIKSNDPSQNHLYRDLRIEGFQYGIQIPKEGDAGQSVPFVASRLEDSYLANNTYNLWKYGGTQDPVEYFEIANSQFETNQSNQSPTAGFVHQGVGGLAVRFDGSSSVDSDAPTYLKSTGNEIVSWGWDLDNNGTVDKYGRQIDHYFDAAGSYQVNLTVWDSQGATDTTAQTIDVTSTEYGNLIVDGDFNSTAQFGGKAYKGDSTRAGDGWVASNWKKDFSLREDGAAVVSSPAYGNNLRQIVLDNSIRKGMQNLALDIKNIEQATNANQITISVWGIDGQFNAGSISETKPTQVGALPMNAVNLLEETVGGSSFDWTNMKWNLDFDDGYQYVLFDIAVQGADSSKGDLVAIDNVEIK